jgi:hypothetical protein
MRNGHMIQFSRSRNRSKKIVAQAARGVFEIPAIPARLSRDVGSVADKFEIELRSEFAGEPLVFIGFGTAKLMVKVQDKNSDPEVPL